MLGLICAWQWVNWGIVSYMIINSLHKSLISYNVICYANCKKSSIIKMLHTFHHRDIPWEFLLWVSTNPTHLNQLEMVVYGVDDVFYWICTEDCLAVSKGGLWRQEFSGEHNCVGLMKVWCLKLSGRYRKDSWEILCNNCVAYSIF